MLRKVVGGILIVIGLIFLIPEGLDFLNIGLGHYLSDSLGITLFQGILLTYTLVPAVLIVLGAVLMPGSTQGILSSTYRRVMGVFKRLIASPWGLVVIAGLLLMSYLIYTYMLKPYIEAMV